jgi:hypothetical protein
MKAVKTTLEGVTYYLVLNGEAMFQIRDSFDSTKLLLEAMQKDTREGFKATCAAAAILAEQGELVRRRLGYLPGEIPETADFAVLSQPSEITALKNAVIHALTLGYGREIKAPGDAEYDEGLEELNQKKTKLGERIITR